MLFKSIRDTFDTKNNNNKITHIIILSMLWNRKPKFTEYVIYDIRYTVVIYYTCGLSKR